MIPETIEKVIRGFDYCEYDLHTLHDLEEGGHSWPPALAEQISIAIAPEIEAILRQGMDYAAKIAITASRGELGEDE